MEGELDLLLSVAGGLGKWHDSNDTRRVYIKDDDCLGAWVIASPKATWLMQCMIETNVCSKTASKHLHIV